MRSLVTSGLVIFKLYTIGPNLAYHAVRGQELPEVMSSNQGFLARCNRSKPAARPNMFDRHIIKVEGNSRMRYPEGKVQPRIELSRNLP